MKKICWTLVLFGFAIQAKAQFAAPGLDGKQYTPQNSQTNKKDAKEGPHDFNNTIYLNLSHAVRGIGSIGYQRMIIKHLAVKASVGYCFAVDPTSFFIYTDNESNYTDTKALPTYMMDDSKLQAKKSIYSDFGIKYCSRLREADYSDVTFRMYVGVDFRRYNYQLMMPTNYRYSINDERSVIAPVKQQAYHLLAGMQVYRSGGYSWELYTGLGIINRKAYNFTRGEFESYYSQNASLSSYNTLQLVLGWNVGFSF
jgi:hypothetical protein